MDASASDYRERLYIVSGELNMVNQRLERLYDALETSSLQLADLAPRIQLLRQRQEQLNSTRFELENLLTERKVELADIETVKNCVEDLRNLLEHSPIAERKSFINSFVREVRVAGSQVSLNYIPPLLTSMKSRETFLVPSIVHDSGPRCTIDRTFFLSFSLRSEQNICYRTCR